MLRIFDLPATAHAHLRFWLKQGAAGWFLSEYFSQEPIERGIVRTALPDTVDPSEVEKYETDLSWKKWSRDQHQEVWREAREWLLGYLAKRMDGIAIADYWRDPEKPLSDIPMSNYFACRSQFPKYRSASCCLYIAKEDVNAGRVDAFLRVRGDAVVLLTSVGEFSKHLSEQPVSDALLMDAALNSVHALSRAYDQSAFICWTREGHPALLT